MKKNYEIVQAIQVRGKWWRVDYVNKEGILEFETVEALDSHEAYQLASSILYKKYNPKPKRSSK